MTHQNPAQPGEQIPPHLPEEHNKSNQQPDDVVHVPEKGSSGLETCQYNSDVNNEGSSLEGRQSSSAPVVVDVGVAKEAMRPEDQLLMEEDNGRERLKKHRIEVAGRVWIPEIWGQEELLKDWVDCSAFDASLVPSGIMSARAALVEEGRRANSGGFRIENRC
ncbi:hypothetical protein REPUB_Repub02eG0221500 [Reevesia pubescens]